MESVFFTTNEKDNVAVALSDIEPGIAHFHGATEGEIYVCHLIPFGHKIALQDIACGGGVIKYGIRIAVASVPIKKGDHVHIHNAKSMEDIRSNSIGLGENQNTVSGDKEYTLV
jgi:altronate dehydratase